MDGLLLNTGDLYTKCLNKMLESRGLPVLPIEDETWLQGRTADETMRKMQTMLDDISEADYKKELSELQDEYFPQS